MLKRLELVGFKSFADKTHFDFADGVTGVIGPNGSGKSNVVDAVRWVLGEQSAKSLRGGEMTDVIFNGSASRRSLGMAEVSMVFDNTRKTLATDAPEVRITRRVYRSGEGEYLINNQPVRLKDIKDLFLGSGAGTDAYCIIQQGQVDVLLQTAPKERRTIFEEAAGISRFKAKKIETLRRLERVDGNVQRLRDILDEVDKQLRTVRLQASKAQRYQEYRARLQELRIGLSLREMHVVHGRLSVEAVQLEQLRESQRSRDEQAADRSRELSEVEQRLEAATATLREQEGVLNEARTEISAEQARLKHEWSAFGQMTEEIAGQRRRLAALTWEVARMGEACERSRQELGRAQEQFGQERRKVEQQEALVAENEARLVTLKSAMERDREDSFEFQRQVATLENEGVQQKAQLDNLKRERNRLEMRSAQVVETLASVDGELDELTAAEEALQTRLTEARSARDAVRTQRDQLVEARDDTARQAADLRAERSGLMSRIEVLENLERSHEGLSAGAREVYAHLESPNPGPWNTVPGIVADFLRVQPTYAPLIDLALGDRAVRFLVRDMSQLAQALRERGAPFSGRVSFLPLESLSRPTKSGTKEPSVSLAGASFHPGVVATAEQVVRCTAPGMTDLPARLLANTYIVRDLVAAAAVVLLVPGSRCITLAGELLEADGSLTVGTHHAEVGILSRKTELRELREELRHRDARIIEVESVLADLRERIATIETQLGDSERRIEVLAEQANDMRWRLTRRRQERQELAEEVTTNRSEIGALEQDLERLQATWERTVERTRHTQEDARIVKNRLDAMDREVREREQQRIAQGQNAVAARVALSRAEERLLAQGQRQEQADADLQRRSQEHERLSLRLGELLTRFAELEASLLRGTTVLAAAHARKETAERLVRELRLSVEQARTQRQELNEQMQQYEGAWRRQQEQLHALELSVAELSHRREGLAARIREDYQLDLAALYQQHLEAGRAEELSQPLANTSEGGEEVTPEEEIEELKRKLSKLGNVNLEAIEELQVLEARHTGLKVQFDDLTSSQKTLQDIINRINEDSRRLFTETFETIKGHFQELFRKLFGGGMADIVLEAGDILESGIEIVARPPGKELRSISLMSGGEKTMTAVALLMAIFRSKPSPFCILDEVDAALDEANVGRFTSVLKEFVDRSQFIIVTHHKRTMAAADVLYGVTMQESGVSSRFSVRFEDWPDDEKKPQTPAA